jgi:hypothetical protein
LEVAIHEIKRVNQARMGKNVGGHIRAVDYRFGAGELSDGGLVELFSEAVHRPVHTNRRLTFKSRSVETVFSSKI